MNEQVDPARLPGPTSVENLLNLEQIRQLKARYFQAVDEKDYRAIERIFTEDAIVDFSGEIAHRIGHQGVTAGADPSDWRSIGGRATGAVIADSVRDLVTVHHGHDPQIEVTGTETARGRWTMQDIIDFEQETMIGHGVYIEEYRLEGGRWRISYLRLERLRVTWEPR